MRHPIWRISVLHEYGIVFYRTKGKMRRYPITPKRENTLRKLPGFKSDDSRFHGGSLSRLHVKD